MDNKRDKRFKGSKLLKVWELFIRVEVNLGGSRGNGLNKFMFEVILI